MVAERFSLAVLGGAIPFVLTLASIGPAVLYFWVILWGAYALYGGGERHAG